MLRNIFSQVRFKIFFLNCAVLIAAILTFGSVLYSQLSEVTLSKEYENIMFLSSNVNSQVNLSLLSYQKYLTDINAKIIAKGISSEAFDEIIKLEQPPLYSDISSLYYISEDEYRNEQVNNDKKKVYEAAIASKNSFVIIEPYIIAQRGNILTLVIKSMKGSAMKGILACDISLQSLNARFASINSDKNLSFIAYSENYKPIICSIYINHRDYSSLLPQFRNVMENDSGKIVELESNQEKEFIVSCSRLGLQNWKLVVIADKEAILKPITRIENLTYIFIVLFSFVIAAVSMLLAGHISKPISSIIRQMNNINSKNIKTPIQLKGNDEFSLLAAAYNNMLTKIDALIEEKEKVLILKKEYEFKALQAQINPHFLYNTINAVNSLLDLGKTEDISLVLNALISLLRYTFDKEGELITVQQELHSLEQYIYIQSVRHQYRIRVQYDLDLTVLNCRILKLTMQPIVENAIFHGFNEPSQNDLIKIGGRFENEGKDVLLYVEDNGVGIPEKKLRVLLTDAKINRNSLNSVGLKNINERIKLHYGNEYGLSIWSDGKSKTRVEIRIPKRLYETEEMRIAE